MFCSPKWKLHCSQWVPKEYTCYLFMKTAKPSLWTYFMLHDALEVTCFYSISLLSAWLPFFFSFFFTFFLYFVWNSQIAPGNKIRIVQMVKEECFFFILSVQLFLFYSEALQKCQTFSLTSWHISVICKSFSVK